MTKKNSSSDRFIFEKWSFNAEEAKFWFDYRDERFGCFREEVRLPFSSEEINQLWNTDLTHLGNLLHIAIGVSYYKTSAAEHLVFPKHYKSDAVRSFSEALYMEGLAEFYIRADLPYPTGKTFSFEGASFETTLEAENAPSQKPQNRAAITAFGGGKDSYVADAILEKAGIKSTLCSVVMSEKVATIIQKTAHKPVTFLRRNLDMKLRDVAKRGAYNGHVPITAINSLILTIYAHLKGAAYVVFANERSADEPTIVRDDFSANHQYSKTSFFENILRNAITDKAPSAPNYFSILRPYSELWIAKAFSSLTYPFENFTSCNKNFQITGAQSAKWCGDCAKCAFTTLLISPYLSADVLKTIFPDNFLDKQSMLPIYEELCGLSDKKPWDCVGTINECRAAIYQLSKDQNKKDYFIVRTLLPKIMMQNKPEALEKFWIEGLQPVDAHFVPSKIMEAARGF